MKRKQYNNTYKVQTPTDAEDGNISNSLKWPGTYLFVRRNKVCEEPDFWPESCDSLLGYFINNQIKRMKKMIIFIGFVAFFSSAHSTTVITPVSSTKLSVRADEVYLPVGTTGRLISLMDLSKISVKDFETLSGKKMKFLDKVNFKVGQRQLKKSINPDGTFSKSIEKFLSAPAGSGGGFSLVGLLLGLFLSLIGVLIAYVIAGTENRSRVTWAWIGAAISLIIWGAILI